MARQFPNIDQPDMQSPKLLRLNDNFTKVAAEIDKVEAKIPAAGAVVQIAYATANLTLTTSFADVPGAGIGGLGPGTYLVIGVFAMLCTGAGDVGNYLAGILALNGNPVVNTSTLGRAAVLTPQTAAESATVSQQWLVSIPASGGRLSLQAAKQGGSGTSACLALDTSISTIYAGQVSITP